MNSTEFIALADNHEKHCDVTNLLRKLDSAARSLGTAVLCLEDGLIEAMWKSAAKGAAQAPISAHEPPTNEVVVSSILYFPHGRICILKGQIRTRILLECLTPNCEFNHHTRDAIRHEWEREVARGRQGYVCRLSQAAGYLELPTAELGGWLRLLRHFCQRIVTPRVPVPVRVAVRVWVTEAGEFDDYHDPDYDGSDDEDEEDEDGDYDEE